MGIAVSYGVEDFFKESINNNFADKTFLMLGYQNLSLSKADLYVIAKKLGAKLNYSVLKKSRGGSAIVQPSTKHLDLKKFTQWIFHRTKAQI